MSLIRDKGLQPERTSMSWLRTQLVLFCVGLIYIRGTVEFAPLVWIGLTAMVFASVSTLYNKIRFTRQFFDRMAASRDEARVKVALSAVILLLSGSYLLVIWHQFLF